MGRACKSLDEVVAEILRIVADDKATFRCQLCGRGFNASPVTACVKAKDGKHVFDKNAEATWLKIRKRNELCKRILVLLGIIAIFLCLVFVVRTGPSQKERQEQFIHLDYADVIASSVKLPFECRLKGEHNALEVKLDTLEKIFPYRGRISVVLHGTGNLLDLETGNVRERPDAALRFSFALSADDEGFLTLYDPELDSLSVYSDSPDVEAIVQRTTLECWKSFVSSMAPWKLDLTNLPFKPEHDVQVENDGVFVFGKGMRK